MTCSPRVPLLHGIALLAWCLDDIIVFLVGWERCHSDQSSSNRLVIPSVTKLLILGKSVFALGVLRGKINTAQVLMVSFPVHAGKTMATLDSLSQSPWPLCQHKSLCIISPTLSRAEPPRPQLRPLFLTRKPISVFYSQLKPLYSPSRFRRSVRHASGDPTGGDRIFPHKYDCQIFPASQTSVYFISLLEQAKVLPANHHPRKLASVSSRRSGFSCHSV